MGRAVSEVVARADHPQPAQHLLPAGVSPKRLNESILSRKSVLGLPAVASPMFGVLLRHRHRGTYPTFNGSAVIPIFSCELCLAREALQWMDSPAPV